MDLLNNNQIINGLSALNFSAVSDMCCSHHVLEILSFRTWSLLFLFTIKKKKHLISHAVFLLWYLASVHVWHWQHRIGVNIVCLFFGVYRDIWMFQNWCELIGNIVCFMNSTLDFYIQQSERLLSITYKSISPDCNLTSLSCNIFVNIRSSGRRFPYCVLLHQLGTVQIWQRVVLPGGHQPSFVHTPDLRIC